MTPTEQYITELVFGWTVIAAIGVVSFAIWGCP